MATADALSTELHALLKGLQLALDRHLLPLEINVDAQLLVDLLYTDFTTFHLFCLTAGASFGGWVVLPYAMSTESRTN